MDKIVDLQNLKSKNYISLSINLNDEIKNVSFEDDVSYIGGYYNFEEKKLTLNIKKLLQLRKLNIISNNNFIIEYLTILFHEIFHAIQQANIETIEPTKKCVDNRRILCKIYLKII